jgi:hypothetical protein
MCLLSRRWLSLLIGVLLVAFGILMHVRRQQIRQQRQERPFGQFTQAQLAHRTQPLFALLAPGKACWMAFTTGTFRRPDGADSHIWDVDCLQANSPDAAHLAHFQWYADTGTLRSVSCSELNQVLEGNYRQITEQQAMEQSWYWLRALGFAKAGSRWACTPGPKPNTPSGSWKLHWRNGGEEVDMHIDGVSSRCLYALSNPESPTGR